MPPRHCSLNRNVSLDNRLSCYLRGQVLTPTMT